MENINSNYNHSFPVIANEPTVAERIAHANSLEQCKEIAREHLDCSKYFLSTHQKLLFVLVYSENPDLSVVKSVLQKAIEEYPITNVEPREKRNFPSPPGLNPEDQVIISWGGGLDFLNKFLENKHEGYANEAGGRGMFVTVQRPGSSGNVYGRDYAYATREAPKYYDIPAEIKGTIQVKYLKQVNHNGYEAVIFPEDIKNLMITEKIDHTASWAKFSDRKFALQQTIPIPQIYKNLDREGYTADEVMHLKSSWAQFTGVHPNQLGC